MVENKVTIVIDTRNAAQAKRALKEIGIQSKTMGQQMQTTSKMATLLTHAMRALGAVGIGLILRNMARDAIEFESAFAGVRKTVDATEAEFDQLSRRLVDLSKEIPVTAKELAGIQEIAGQLGVRGVAALTKFTDTIARISVSTNLTKEVAATAFARIATVMEEPLENVDRMGASIVELGNNFATTEAEITNFAQRIAGAGKIFGLTTANILALGTAFTAVGVQAQVGGTAVQKVLIAILQASKEGGEKFQTYLRILGLTREEFKKIKEEAPEQIFIKFVQALGAAGDDAILILKEIGLQDQRLIRALLSLAGAGDLVTRTINTSNKAWEENNALNIESAKRFGTTASQIQIFKNNVAALNIAMGEGFLPILQDVLPVLSSFISGLEKLSGVYNTVKTGTLNLAIALASLSNSLPGRRGDLDNEIARLVALRDQSADTAQKHLFNTEAILIQTEERVAKEIELERISVEATANIQEEASKKSLEQQFSESAKQTALLDIWVKSNLSAWDLLTKAKDTFAKGVSKSFMDMIQGTANVGDAFKDLGLKIVQVLLDWAIQAAINSALSKAFKAAEVAAAAVTGGAIAAAFAPAAAMVSLATAGANAAPAAAGIAATHALAATLAIPKFQEGGIIPGSSEGTLLIAGENNRREAIIPLDRGRGLLPESTTINITVNAIINQELDLQLLAEELGFLMERESFRPRTIG